VIASQGNAHRIMRHGLGAVVVAALLALEPAAASLEPRSAFESWLQEGDHAATFQEFTAFLGQRGLERVVEPWTLLRQGSSWRDARQPAFAFPPRALWPNIVPTLEALRDEIIPRVGPVQVWSGFRTREYNERAGGAARSSHLTLRGVDVVPMKQRSRAELHAILDGYWRSAEAKQRAVGIGFYRNDTGRFHVDAATRHRRW